MYIKYCWYVVVENLFDDHFCRSMKSTWIRHAFGSILTVAFQYLRIVNVLRGTPDKVQNSNLLLDQEQLLRISMWIQL